MVSRSVFTLVSGGSLCCSRRAEKKASASSRQGAWIRLAQVYTSAAADLSDSAAMQILLQLDENRDGPLKFKIRQGERSLRCLLQPSKSSSHAQTPPVARCREKQESMLIPVDDKHILVKQQYLEEFKYLLQEEVSPVTLISAT